MTLNNSCICYLVLFSWAVTPPIQSHLFSIAPETSDIQQSLNNAALQLGIAFGTLFGSFIIDVRSVSDTAHFGIIFVAMSFIAAYLTTRPPQDTRQKQIKV